MHAIGRLTLTLLLLTGCGFVKNDISHRDLGVDARAVVDSGTPTDADAPIDGSSADAAVMVGADATRAVLVSIGERVILPTLRDFEADAQALVAATAAARDSGSAESRAAAREAWREAMRSWERVEMLQVGPTGLVTVTAGGRALRDEIYAWPLLNRCRVDQETLEPAHADPALLAAESLNVRGLAALEYLLFFEAPNNGCSASHSINASGAWAALDAAAITSRRAAYAHSAAVLVASRATELRWAWDPSGENFLGNLRAAGTGSDVYMTAQAGLNAVSDALFYLYKEVTDNKVGIPMGLTLECTTALCPEQVESRYAGASLDHMRVNLEAFRDAYLGGPPEVTDAPGFDDLLRSVGATDLDARIQAGIAAAFTALAAVDTPFESALTNDYADAVTFHDALRNIGGLFRIDVLTMLDLELPMRIEGDND